MADPHARQKVVDWVERQMTSWRGNRFLITSRPFGYSSNPLPNVAVLEVRPFTTEQVERFVHQWYLAIEIMSKLKDDPGVRMRASNDADALLQRLRTTPEIFDLTVNPLLLTMIATVHRYGGELPGNRCALYAEMCEVFLGKRQQARGQSLEFTPVQTQAVLAPLAAHMMSQGIRDIACDEAQH
ncbi:MAG: NACHT domain-containing protein, partial [Ktedonobacteraceae bacterium]